MVELVYTMVLEAIAARLESSSLSARTNFQWMATADITYGGSQQTGRPKIIRGLKPSRLCAISSVVERCPDSTDVRSSNL